MSRSFDVKSGIIGGLLALLILSALGGAPWMSDGLQCRFTMISHPGHAFLLDTVTGQVWPLWVLESGPASAEQSAHSMLTFYEPKVGTGLDPNRPVY